MLEKTGVPSETELVSIMPSEERLAGGPVAIVECFQKIPCDPCFYLCKKGAFKRFQNINDLPEIDFKKCTGCGLCISGCPGLAIYVVDLSGSSNGAVISMPYELLPLPKKGEKIFALDREGKTVGTARVVKVRRTKDKTSVVTIAVQKDLAMTVRNIGFTRSDNVREHKANGETYLDSEIICQCEDVTSGDIREAIAKGYQTVEEVKRFTRAGMGQCQGRNCTGLIIREIAKVTGKRQDMMSPFTFRPPVKPMKLQTLARKIDE